MPVFEPGRVCVKIAGRDAGKISVIVDIIDENFVVVEGPKVKRKRCNIAHLEALPEKIELKEGIDVKKVLEERFGAEIKFKKPEES